MFRGSLVSVMALTAFAFTLPRALAQDQTKAGVPADASSQVKQSYAAPDGKAHVTIKGVSKRGPADSESLVEIHSADGKLLYSESYASKDGEHGWGVVSAGWTPDSQFFVWTTESSGGHSPWHFPTYFFSRKLNRVFSLDKMTGPITTSEFVLKSPHTLASKRLMHYGKDIQGEPFTANLDELQTGKPLEGRLN